MATRKVTLSLEDTAWVLASQAAARAGMSPSAWISRAARREAVRTGVGPALVVADGSVEDVEEQATLDEAELRAAEEQSRRAAG